MLLSYKVFFNVIKFIQMKEKKKNVIIYQYNYVVHKINQ